MDTILTIISMGLVITALVLCICTWRALRPVSKPQHRAGYKHSALERRRKSLELATKEWNRKLSRGHIFLAGEQKHLVDQLEREVAALEDELFGTAEEPTPKEEAPKLEHDTTMSGEYLRKWGWMYRAECSACDWWQDSYSPQTAVEKGVEHEGRHV